MVGLDQPSSTSLTGCYKATGNLPAVQILLGPTKFENTVCHLGVDVDDALTLAENTEIGPVKAPRHKRGAGWVDQSPPFGIDLGDPETRRLFDIFHAEHAGRRPLAPDAGTGT